ncbi:hypothetical protein TRFO_31930 [Tritrichomonas foetus]|uniref:C2 domain-containing protein n=1 Tax=Tritrichomonas foetus TaxID=1144522 RepID=A0A1J4JR84_9EUKA|nr:hypothetical protein TRFO_31930 [Tritrichomonas foetus]|eukprot:OHT01266.1 hypothetical protein TRFO_31930 [Tritrichomonas foetus]
MNKKKTQFHFMSCELKIISSQGLFTPDRNPSKLSPYVSIIAHSSYDSYIGETRCKNNTSNPVFNETFNFDFYRASYFDFYVYHHRIIIKDVLIGVGRLEVKNIVQNEEIIVPISLIDSKYAVSTLTVKFNYNFSPLITGDFKSSLSYVVLYTSQSPPINEPENANEIKCLVKNTHRNYCYFLDGQNWWTTAGRSAGELPILCGSGFSQQRVLNIAKLKKCETCFIIKSKNYTGKVTLNFACMKSENRKNLTQFFNCGKSAQVFHQIDFTIKAGEEIYAPEKLVTLSFGKIRFIEKDDHTFLPIDCVERKIMAMTKPMQIPSEVTNVQLITGGFIHFDNNTIYVTPKILVFEKETNRFIDSLKQKMIRNQTMCNGAIVDIGYSTTFNKSNGGLWDKYADHHSVTINFSGIPQNYVLFIGVKLSDASICDAQRPFIRMVDRNTSNEIFFCPFKVPYGGPNSSILFKIEFVDDSWTIIPIYLPVMKSQEMRNVASQYMHSDQKMYNPIDWRITPLLPFAQNNGNKQLDGENEALLNVNEM